MSGFFPTMFAEMGARRKRLRTAFGDRGQGIVEFLVLAGLLVGSLGLFVREWMPAAAPWGFAIPFVFVAGYLLIEVSRQRAIARYQNEPAPLNADLDAKEWSVRERALRNDEYEDHDEAAIREAKARFDADKSTRDAARLERPEAIFTQPYDRTVFFWAFACALLSAAAFAIAWTSQHASTGPQEDWRPPSGTVPTEIGP
ncbi:MAG: hypothetical protein QM759_09655 [Terricaulis sp.]